MAKSRFTIKQEGKELSATKYTWDENTKTFSTSEDDLVLDFSDYAGVTFKTGSNCTFTTLFNCIFKTGSDCIFDTGFGCTFKTGSGCSFNTGHNCTFNTGSNCMVVCKDVFEVMTREQLIEKLKKLERILTTR